MPRLPVLSGRELIQARVKVGFEPRRRKGSHVVLARGHGKDRIVVIIPDHPEIDRGTLVELRQARLSSNDFLELLERRTLVTGAMLVL
jgi:predicted RNA binding protein YcfA (HicA-like mRNA interferase family)